jgi:hypothetical protein
VTGLGRRLASRLRPAQPAPAAEQPEAAPEEPEPAGLEHRERATALGGTTLEQAALADLAAADGDLVESRDHRTLVLVALGVAVVAALTSAGLLIGGGFSPGLLVPVFVMLIAAFVVLFLGGRTSEVRLEGGVLHLRLGDERRTFDLGSESTVIEVRAEPSSPDWAVVFVRRGLAPVQVDRRVVDPVAFTRAMSVWRPDLFAA